jgi:hypothetical protein
VGRYLLAAGVVLADTTILAAGHHGLPVWAVPAYALTAALVIAAGSRIPVAALAAAVLLAVLTGASQILLLWTAYQAGSKTRSRPVTVLAAAAALAGLGAQAATRHPDARMLSGLVSTYVVFVALPMVSGCYLAQHRRVLSGLHEQNRQLHRGERPSPSRSGCGSPGICTTPWATGSAWCRSRPPRWRSPTCRRRTGGRSRNSRPRPGAP